MLTNDRVLVAFVPRPADFERIQRERWYHVPVRHAPKGVYAEWVAFYFGGKHGAEKHAVRFVARNQGHELALRRDLFPEQAGHERAGEWYFKIQLGEVMELDRPILATTHKRILFIHTTGDRFQAARAVADLFSTDPRFVNRRAVSLRESASPPYAVPRP